MTVFVGRETELNRLRAAYQVAMGGRGTIVLVSGEPGIGKTRLVEEFAAEATTSGTPVAWGRANQDEGSPPFWIFNRLATTVPNMPEVTVGVAPQDAASERRFETFERYWENVRLAAEPNGMVMILDDLHWADASSLALVTHVAFGLTLARIMIVAMFRDTELIGGEALDASLLRLARADSVERIDLPGLSVAEVRQHLMQIRSSDISEQLAATVTRRTGGNPFFVSEVAAMESLIDQETPTGVLDTVRARVGRLDATAQLVITFAAVLGDDIDPSALAVVSGIALPDVLDALDAARSARIVSASEGWRFHHDLIREAVRSTVATSRKLAAHAAMAEYLESRPSASARPAEIAHHFLESLPLSVPAKALQWVKRAADQALGQFAWERAAELLQKAVEAEAYESPEERALLLLEQGRALLNGGDLRKAFSVLAESADAARELGDSVALGQVALAVESMSDPGGRLRGGDLAQEALAGLPDEDAPLRARLLAIQSGEAAFFGGAEADSLSADALAMAERLGGPTELRSALRSRQMVQAGPDGVVERLVLADRMIGLGRSESDQDAALWGHLWRFDALAMLGRLNEAETELALIGEIVERVRRRVASLHHLRCRAAIDLARGRFAEAADATREGLALIEDRTDPSLVALSTSVLLALASLTGHSELVTDAEIREFGQGPPNFVNPVMAAYWMRLGDLERARSNANGLGVAELPSPALLPGLATGIEVCARLGMRAAVGHLAGRLRPYSDLFVAGGAGAVLIWGPVHTPLGIASSCEGNLDSATRQLRIAVDSCEAAGTPPFAALARLELGKVLGRRRRPGDAEEAEALFVTVAAAANRLGMGPLQRDAEELRTGQMGQTVGPLTPREAEVAGHVARGLTNKQIAAMMKIAERTAETHVQHILTKLALANRTQIAGWHNSRTMS